MNISWIWQFLSQLNVLSYLLIWMIFWSVLFLILNFIKLKQEWNILALRAKSNNLTVSTVFFPFIKAVSKPFFTRLFIALNRMFLIFVAWCVARSITFAFFKDGMLYWLSTISIFFLIIFGLKMFLGHVGSRDESGRRLTKEFISAVIGSSILIII